ncbi:MAG: ABC transporter ATP-binding protein [Thermoplasmata archaeon]|nr:ABC transporter ATP-binding protein [Thermoplasmata archaeon]RLF27316.1 MAG: ABC transporter ATP-binding protein [Thermoplasmata archaeon]
MPTESSPSPIIEIVNVTKIYEEYESRVTALKNVSLTINSGEFVAIVGTSGCGKSTLLHCMGLLDRPTSGKIYIEGKDTEQITGKEIAAFRGKRMGFVFQNYNLIPRLTVLENTMLPGLIAGKGVGQLKEKALKLLREVGISHRAHHKGVHLSGGEQQRVAIARALINDPIIVLADEPTGALDSKSSTEIMELLENLNENKGVTIVFVSHDVEIARYGKRRVELKDGRIVTDRKVEKKQQEKVE